MLCCERKCSFWSIGVNYTNISLKASTESLLNGNGIHASPCSNPPSHSLLSAVRANYEEVGTGLPRKHDFTRSESENWRTTRDDQNGEEDEGGWCLAGSRRSRDSDRWCPPSPGVHCLDSIIATLMHYTVCVNWVIKQAGGCTARSHNFNIVLKPIFRSIVSLRVCLLSWWTFSAVNCNWLTAVFFFSFFFIIYPL